MTGVTPQAGPGSRPTGGAAKASPAKPSIPNAALADKLDEARALIERGWRQSRFTSRAGDVCALGALNKAIGGCAARIPQDDEWDRAYGFVRLAVGGCVINWNDAPGRTQAEVIDAFKRAAELARAGEQ